jgi:hypothetical protein
MSFLLNVLGALMIVTGTGSVKDAAGITAIIPPAHGFRPRGGPEIGGRWRERSGKGKGLIDREPGMIIMIAGNCGHDRSKADFGKFF